MSTPVSLRDGDGSEWIRQSDGTYRLRKGNGTWSERYQGYSLAQIRDEFDGIRSQRFDDEDRTRDYNYSRSR